MTALLALVAPILPYIFAGIVALIGGGGFILNEKRKSKNQGIAEQQAKEAQEREQELDRIKSAAGANPSVSVQLDPDNRDNAKG